MFYKRKGSDLYHWRKDCSQVPGNVYHSGNWLVLSKYVNPAGAMCKECAELDMKSKQPGGDGFTWKLTQT